MPGRFDHFIHKENVRNYKRQLVAALDPVDRRILTALLDEEAVRAKVEGWAPTFK